MRKTGRKLLGYTGGVHDRGGSISNAGRHGGRN